MSILEGNTVPAKATSLPNLPTPPPVYHSLSFSLYPLPVECYHSSLQPPAAPAADASARKSFFQLQSYQHQNSENPNWTKTYKVSRCNLVLHVQYTCCISHFCHSQPCTLF